jgi:hypothetical protein
MRVEIPVSVISLDRMRPFGEKCLLLVVSAQGCGFRTSEALQLETPIMLSGLPGGGSVTARVANCLPLGDDGKHFLIGAALYTHGNVWGICRSAGDRAKQGLALQPLCGRRGIASWAKVVQLIASWRSSRKYKIFVLT